MVVGRQVLLAQGISRLLWERDNAWLHDSLPGGCRKPGMPLPNEKTCGDWTFRQKPSTRRAGEAQYLGEMPWVSRATAMRPDQRYVARDRTKVKYANKRQWKNVKADKLTRAVPARPLSVCRFDPLRCLVLRRGKTIECQCEL